MENSAQSAPHTADGGQNRSFSRRRFGLLASAGAAGLVLADRLPRAVATPPDDHTGSDPNDGVEEHMVPTPEMPDVKVRLWRATNGSKKSVILLDGLRATWDVSGWEHMTNVYEAAKKGINVVMPVGGNASFYTDWDAPSNLNNQPYRYMWETFIGTTLPNFLGAKGLSSTGNAIMGLSMGGGAALILAANHRDRFGFAGALSGFLNITAPGMREAIRAAMLSEQGFNSDNMWGPPWSPRWPQNDPTMRINDLTGIPLYISAARGGATEKDSDLSGVDKVSAAGLETIAYSQTKSFQEKAQQVGLGGRFVLDAAGTHNWPYWQDHFWDSLDYMKQSIGA
jgi:diacylglycerol O-acyltransferase/trehalose O-mycolyltransferase